MNQTKNTEPHGGFESKKVESTGFHSTRSTNGGSPPNKRPSTPADFDSETDDDMIYPDNHLDDDDRNLLFPGLSNE